jgi:putative membrane protein
MWGMPMLIWWLMGLVLFVLIVVLIMKTGPKTRDGRKFRDIINERYARGEIDEVEYKKLKRGLIDRESMYEN